MIVSNSLVRVVLALNFIALTGCGGQSGGNGAGGPTPYFSPFTAVQKPQGFQLSQSEIERLAPQFLKIGRGMFMHTIETTYTKVDQKPCKQVTDRTEVVLKVDAKEYYTYSITEVTGGLSMDEHNALKCDEATHYTNSDVRTSKLVLTYEDLKNEMGGIDPVLYRDGNSISFYSEMNNSEGSAESLVVFESPETVPGFIGIISIASSVRLHANSRIPEMVTDSRTSRAGSGTAFPLETLRNALKKISFCPADGSNCIESDQSALID